MWRHKSIRWEGQAYVALANSLGRLFRAGRIEVGTNQGNLNGETGWKNQLPKMHGPLFNISRELLSCMSPKNAPDFSLFYLHLI